MSKKRLTFQQEFEIMKMVLDKFLWLGFIVMGWGFFQAVTNDLQQGLYYIVAGAILLVLLVVAIVREFEVVA